MIRGVLLDLSGVIYTGDEVFPSAIDAVERMRRNGLPLRFLTNASRSPKRKLLQKLRSFRLAIEADELFTPAQAACDWIKEHQRSAYLLIHPDLKEDSAHLGDFPARTLVAGDFGRYFTYESLNEAFRVLVEGAEFLALANNRVFMDRDDKLSFDAGAFVAVLE